MTTTRRDRTTEVSRRRTVYADFDLDFDANPVSLDLKVHTNEEAVGQAIRNIVLTGPGERPFNSSMSSKVRGLLFEPMHGFTAQALRETIVNAIATNEPRATLIGVDVEDDGANTFVVSITYAVRGSTVPATINFLLKRVR